MDTGKAPTKLDATIKTADLVHRNLPLETDIVCPLRKTTKLKRRLVIGASGVLLALLATSVFNLSRPAQSTAMLNSDGQLFELTNQDRISNGVPALQWNSTLGGIGENAGYNACGISIQGRSQDMINRNYFSHTIAGCNQNVFSMLNAFGLSYGWAGENIGWNNYPDPLSSVNNINSEFMNSPDHRANILNPNFTYMGIGSASTGPNQAWSGGGGAYTNVSMYSEEFAQLYNPGAYSPPPNGISTSSTPPLNGSNPAYHGMYATDSYGNVHDASSPAVINHGFGLPLARGIVTRSDGLGGYVLDGWGGVHQFGNAPGAAISGYWPHWDITRGIALRSDGNSGYVLDGFGGIHPFGGAPSVNPSAYWSGWDIARSIVLRPDGVSGYVLDGFGGIHPFGGAPSVNASAYWSGWDIARSMTVLPNSTSQGYVLDGWGGIHPFGGAPPVQLDSATPGQDLLRGISAG